MLDELSKQNLPSHIEKLLPKHPLEKILNQKTFSVDCITDGLHMPLCLEFERQLLQGMNRMSGQSPMPSFNVLLEIIEGRDEILDFEESLNIENTGKMIALFITLLIIYRIKCFQESQSN